MNYRNVILENDNTVQNYALSLAYRMVPGYLLVRVLQMQILNMVPHVRNAFKRTSLFVVSIDVPWVWWRNMLSLFSLVDMIKRNTFVCLRFRLFFG